MKFIWSLSIASFVLIIVAMFLPYTQLSLYNELTLEKFGKDYPIALFQVVFTTLIFIISSIVRNRITSAIAFALCFGFSIYFIVLSYFISSIDLGNEGEFSYGIGLYLAVLSSILCWMTHLLNVIRVYRSEIKKENNI